MWSKLLSDDGVRTYALVYDRGNEVMRGLQDFAAAGGSPEPGSQRSARSARRPSGYFDWERKDYEEIEVDEQVEVLTLAGDIATKGSEPAVHAHVVLGRSDGTALGGHLLRALVRPTLEVMLTEVPAQLQKRLDEETGLALIDLDA